MKTYLSYCILLLFGSFSVVGYAQNTLFHHPEPTTIDYGNLENWAAHPNKRDNADRIPATDGLAPKNLKADVFFIHPTIYTKKGKDLPWNPSLNDSVLNNQVDNSTILFQASAFNAAGRVFAPRYRQAHLSAYSTTDTLAAKKALAFAYEDVKNAFEYYLKYYNNGRRVLHMQGRL